MIYNQWYAILDSKEILQNRPITVVRLGEKLVLRGDLTNLKGAKLYEFYST